MRKRMFPTLCAGSDQVTCRWGKTPCSENSVGWFPAQLDAPVLALSGYQHTLQQVFMLGAFCLSSHWCKYWFRSGRHKPRHLGNLRQPMPAQSPA